MPASGIRNSSHRSTADRGWRLVSLDIRGQDPYPLYIRLVYQGPAAKDPHPLRRFPGQQMALARVGADDLPRAGGTEALGRPPIALHLGHESLSLLLRNVKPLAHELPMINRL
jgi:hypothetical protein